MKRLHWKLFLIFLALLVPVRSVFSLGPAPIIKDEEEYDFRYSSIIDWDYSTVHWERGKITLDGEVGNFNSSGVLWTEDIRFNPHIFSLTVTGAYSQPSGTRILLYASFGDDLREYPLNWGVPFEPPLVAKKVRLKVFLATSNSYLTPELNELNLKLELKDFSERAPRNRDRSRVYDLKRVQRALDKYHQEFAQYPIVSESSLDKDEQWEALEKILDSATLNHRTNYKRNFRDQVQGVAEDYKYGYLTNRSGNDFLLWVKLEEENSDRFEDSWQGEALGINCQPPLFCLTSVSVYEPDPAIRFFDEEEGGNGDDVRFVKAKDQEKVYLNLDGFRLWLNSPQVFETAGGVWEEIVEMGSTIQELPLARFIRNELDGKIYIVENNGTVREVFNQTMAELYGGLKNVIDVSSDIIQSLPRNYLIQAPGQDKVYFLDQKIKRWVVSPQALERIGFSFEDVVKISTQEIQSYQEGSPVF
ncbi:hypothetical protein K9K85_01670 [Patescibacteria group bacterium]|nr:hypothetical protein [Patescibacteria group bacterium]